MREEEGLLADIAGSPGDETPWLVLADWLEERGEADRSELVRLSVQLRRPEVGDRAGPEARLRQLVLRGSVAHPERVPPEAAARLVRSYLTSAGYEGANAAMRTAVFSGFEDIRVPVTLAWGDLDRIVRKPRETLPEWRTSPLFDDRERAALAYVEEATRNRKVSDATFETRSGCTPSAVTMATTYGRPRTTCPWLRLHWRLVAAERSARSKRQFS